MRKYIHRFSEYIAKVNDYNDQQKEEVEYVLVTHFFEFLKLIGVIFIMMLFKHMLEGFVVLFIISTTKPFIGGFHEDTQLKCFVTTVTIVGCIVFLGGTITLSINSIIILNVVCLFCLWNQVPIISDEMPLTRADLINKNRKIGLSIILIYMLSFIIGYKWSFYSNLGTWTMIFQTLFLFKKKIPQNSI